MKRTECAYDQNCCTDHGINLDKQAKNAPLTVPVAFGPELGQVANNRAADTEVQQTDIPHDRLRNAVDAILGLPQHTEHDGGVDKGNQIADQQIQIGQQRAGLDLIASHA